MALSRLCGDCCRCRHDKPPEAACFKAPEPVWFRDDRRTVLLSKFRDRLASCSGHIVDRGRAPVRKTVFAAACFLPFCLNKDPWDPALRALARLRAILGPGP